MHMRSLLIVDPPVKGRSGRPFPLPQSKEWTDAPHLGLINAGRRTKMIGLTAILVLAAGAVAVAAPSGVFTQDSAGPQGLVAVGPVNASSRPRSRTTSPTSSSTSRRARTASSAPAGTASSPFDLEGA